MSHVGVSICSGRPHFGSGLVVLGPDCSLIKLTVLVCIHFMKQINPASCFKSLTHCMLHVLQPVSLTVFSRFVMLWTLRGVYWSNLSLCCLGEQPKVSSNFISDGKPSKYILIVVLSFILEYKGSLQNNFTLCGLILSASQFKRRFWSL